MPIRKQQTMKLPRKKPTISPSKLKRRQKLDEIGTSFDRFLAEYDIGLLKGRRIRGQELTDLDKKLKALNNNIDARMKRLLLMSLRAKSGDAKKEAEEHAHVLSEMQSQIITRSVALEKQGIVPQGFVHSIFRRFK